MILLGNPPDCLRWLICHAKGWTGAVAAWGRCGSAFDQVRM